MKLTIPFTEFKETINKYVVEGDPLSKKRISTEEELTKSKEELKNWRNRSLEFLKTAFGENTNYLINEFLNAGGNRFSFPGMRTDLDHRIREHVDIFKETVSELSFCLILASISDPLIEGDSYNPEGRDTMSQDQKIAFFLDKLNQINNGGYYPARKIFELNDIKLNHRDELHELLDEMKFNDWIDIHPALGEVHARIKSNGIRLLKQLKEQVLKLKEPPSPAPTVSNVIHVHNMVNSSIQQASINSTQQSQVDIQQNIEELKSFLSELKQSIDSLSIPEELKSELESEIATAEAQAKHPKPRSGAIKETLSSIRKVFEGVSINMIPKLIEKLPELIDKF